MRRDIAERAVAVVPIEMIQKALPRIRHIEVHPAIVIELRRRGRRSHAADPRHDIVELVIEDRLVMAVRDAGGGGHIGEGERHRDGYGRGGGTALARHRAARCQGQQRAAQHPEELPPRSADFAKFHF